MKGIASFDMDMTLLDHTTWKIPDSATKALERLRETYYIVIATGRDLDSKFSAGLKELVNPDAIIHLNGTKITVGDHMIYEHLMSKELVRRLLDFAIEHGLTIGLTTGTEDYYTHPQVIVANDNRRWGKSDRTFKDPKAILDRKVSTLTYIGGEKEAAEIAAAFPEVKLPVFSNKEGADIVEFEVSKSEGLQRLCDYYKVSMKDTIAFGDSMNDYEILRDAGIGVAMGNGIEQVKMVADHVTTSIDEDGIWNACINLGLIEV